MHGHVREMVENRAALEEVLLVELGGEGVGHRAQLLEGLRGLG